MAFVENKGTTSNSASTYKRSDSVNKRKTRTLAKQQQIAESINGISNEILV